VKKKRIFALILMLLVAVSAVLPANATVNSEYKAIDNRIVSPRFTNISIFSNGLNISDSGKATVASQLRARDCDEVKINAYLQRNSNGQWTTIKSWSTTQTGTVAVLEGSWYVLSGYEYRMVSYGYVYSGGTLLESTSYTSGSKTY